jgi:hypothetical protein
MRATVLVPILTVGGISLAATTIGAETAFYVATDGSDGWSGKLPEPNAGRTDGPFRNLGRGRDAIRELKARDGGLAQPATVYLRAGRYELDEALVLTPEDSGTADCPITYAAYGDERPVVSGGHMVGGWKQAGDGLWTVEIPQVKAGDWYFRQLFVKRPEQEQFERRYRPSKGALVIAGLTNAPAREGMAHRQSQDEFRFFPGDIEPWENLDDVEIVALHDWSASRLRIRELDLENRIVRFTGYPVYRIGHWWKDGRNPYYAENVKEALGKPGEWYLDRPTGVLSYHPLPDEDMESLTVIAPRAEQLVKLVGDAEAGLPVEHLQFRGLTFCHTHWTLPEEGYSSGQGMTDLPAAFQASTARNVRIEGCTFAHLGAYAVEFSSGSSDNEVIGNRMFDLGGGGVKVGGGPGTPTSNIVANNLISGGGLVHFSAHGIWAGITEHTVIRHNVVRRFLYSNVSVGWSWNDRPTPCKENVIEHNHIHDSMMLLADGGGIYTLGFQPGTVIRGNHIHDVHRSEFAGRAPNNGMFFDQGSKGFLVERNVIYNTSAAPVRHNQNQPEWHTWVDNSFGVTPDDPAFPEELAAEAGLEAEYAYLDADPIPVTPAPILSMELPPPPPPGPIIDDFEESTQGAGPAKRTIQGADEDVHIRVTDETAAQGTRSLKLTDGPEAEKTFYPYLIYKPEFSEGRATISFHIRLEPGAVAEVEAREYSGGKYTSGPSLRLEGSGRLLAGGKELLRIPAGEWFHLDMGFGLGKDAAPTYDLTVTLPGEDPQRFDALPMVKPEFSRLDWLGITCPGTAEAVFYIDDVRILNE